jgi:ornithine cyclodeaminase
MFAEEMTPIVNAEIICVDHPKKAMESADIVLCMANSTTPVFDGNWLRPGMHVASISAGRDKTHDEVVGTARREIDDATMEVASLIVISSREQVAWDEQKELSKRTERIVDLGDLLTKKVSGRTSDEDINLFASNTGTGNQFCAAGAIVYEKAKAKKMGREIPTEWLMASVKEWSDRGFFPSP